MSVLMVGLVGWIGLGVVVRYLCFNYLLLLCVFVIGRVLSFHISYRCRWALVTDILGLIAIYVSV